jgi:prephenate dehydrogenase
MSSNPKIAIIGVGLLGGSLALALKKSGERNLVGWNHRASSRQKAARLLAVAPSFEQAVENAKVVVLCSHSGSIGPVLRQMSPFIGNNTLILDVSSVKGELVREAQTIAGMWRHFVPCHPMAGKEKSGPGHADPKLYRGKVVFITPLTKNPRPLVQRAAQFWKRIGATPVLLDAKTHDQSVALTSHLPHLLASAMMNLYGKNQKRSPVFQKAVGSGFRDFTRIAAGNPAMWRDIVKMNSVEIGSFLSQYRRDLVILEKNLKNRNSRYWLAFFERARGIREKLK